MSFLHDYWWLFPLVFLLCCGSLAWLFSYDESRPGWRQEGDWTNYLFYFLWILAMLTLMITPAAIFLRFKVL